ncbi:UvrD-helicase domain-containing protein [Caminibacter profundus]
MSNFSIQNSFAISAGAGSGKTYTLSRRYINAYLGFDFFEDAKGSDKLKEADINKIVTITFTEAASLEMKERIFNLMQKIVEFDNLDKNDSDYNSIKSSFSNLDESTKQYVKERLKQALSKIDEAIITTIHGFCFDIVKRYGDFIGFNSSLKVANDLEREAFFEEAMYEVLNDSKFESDILDVSKYLSLFKTKEFIKKYVFSKKFRDYFDRVIIDLDELKKIIKILFSIDDKLIDNANEEIEGLREYFDKLYSFEDVLEFNLFIEEKIGEKLDYRKNTHKEKYANLRILKDNFDFDKFAFDKEKEELFISILNSYKKILEEVYKKYLSKLEENLMIDFDLIIHKADEILDKIDLDYKYVMVDEFQDTNETQFNIVKKIAKNNLFIVGDEKQSIYAFQGGEIEVFKKACKKLQVKTMSDNYRSDREIINFVNKIFAKIFTNDYKIDTNFCATYTPLNSKSNEDGSIGFLVTKDEESEAENVAKYIKEIIEGKRDNKIKEYIDKNQKAIGILFDSKTKMNEFKEALNRYGIECKVNGGNGFWQKDEIKDIFFCLKAYTLKGKLNTTQNIYYLTGAMKSNILHFKEEEIKKYFENLGKKIEFNFLDKYKKENIHKTIRELFNKSGAYLTYENYELALANIEELIREVILLENEWGNDLEKIVSILEENILNANKEEAYYESKTANSIELSSIHYTKGLDYPMVILVNSDKSLLKQSTSEMIKYEKFSINSDEKFLVGFKLDDYSPLAYRVVSEISKLKHIEEKKRLLYVALTRPKHKILISSYNIKNNKIPKNSYIEMILNGLGVTNFERIKDYEVVYSENLEAKSEDIKKKFEIIENSIFQMKTEKKDFSSKNENSILGEAIHEIIEYFYDDLSDKNIEKIIFKYALFDKLDIIKEKINNFKNSQTYKELKKADDVIFEMPYVYNNEEKRVDLIYKYDNKWILVDFKTGKESEKYQDQINTYKDELNKLGIAIDEVRLEFL